MTWTLWRSVHRSHLASAFGGEAAARYPGRYNARGQRAVYLADCPAGCALELVANYAAPEALDVHVLFQVDIDASLVDLRQKRVQRDYHVTLAELTSADDPRAARRVAARLQSEGAQGAIVPAATVAHAFNVVVYPDVWSDFAIRASGPLALDRRVRQRLE